MALQWQNRNVNLLPLNQQAPHSLGPVGRVDTLVNGLVTKFLGGSTGQRMRIQKRPGMTSLPTTVFANGAATTAPASPKLLDSWDDRLVMLAKSAGYVFSEALNSWQLALTPPTLAATTAMAPQTLTRVGLYNSGARANAPDVAAVGDVFCDSLIDSALGSVIVFFDKNGVQTRAPIVIQSGINTRIKVGSDGANFWVYSQPFGTASTVIAVYSPAGAQLATSTITWGSARDHWDIGYQATNARMCLFTPTGATLTCTFSFYGSGTITSTTTTVTSSVTGIAVLANTQPASTNLYVVGADAPGNVTGYEISAAGAITHTYTVAATLGFVGNITGFVNDAGLDLTVAVAILQDNTGAPSVAAINNQIQIYAAPRLSSSSLTLTQRSLALVSRAFVDADGIWRVIGYYQSTASSFVAGPDVGLAGYDPTFYVMDLSNATPQIVGSFEVGNAEAYYASSRQSQDFYPWHLSSVALDLENIQHVPLCYLGTQSSLGGGYITSGLFTNLSGLNDYRISPYPGTSVQMPDNLLIPGLQAATYDGTAFAEFGPGIVPQLTVPVAAGTGGSMTPSESYTYVLVFRWNDASGTTYRSATSPPFAVSLSGAQNSATLTIATWRTTLRAGVFIEVYRTFSPTLNTTPGTELRLVGSIANNAGADTVSFVDTAADSSINTGAELYSQVLEAAANNAQPALGRYTAPPFSSGITADGRAFVIGFDNAVWFSGQKVEGDGMWFNPIFRLTIPSSDRMLRLIPMDARIVIVCSESLWTFPIGNFPDATLANGTIPQPEQLPFTTGALGPAVMTPGGAVYSAPQGIWNMDRGLNNMTFLGSGVIDQVNSDAHPTGLVASSQQRIYALMSSDGLPHASSALLTILVFDLIVGGWYLWNMPATPAFATAWKGKFAWVDWTNCAVHVEDAADLSTYSDDGASIITTIGLSFMAFGGPNDWERLWGLQFYGEWYGPHIMTVKFEFDNVAAVDETYQVPFGVNPGVYRTELRQNTQKDESVEVTFQDGYAWPLIATIVASTKASTQLQVDSVAGFVVGQSYSTVSGGILDGDQFTVNAIDPVNKLLFVDPAGSVLTAGHTITYETNSLATFGNTFSLEAITLRIGIKAGMTKLPTARRAAP